MNPLRVRAVTRRIVAQFRRDRRTLALIFVVPIVLSSLVGLVLREQQAPSLRLAVVNQDAGPAGAALAGGVESALATSSSDTITTPVDEAAGRADLRAGNVDILLVIPPDLTTRVVAHQAPRIVLVTQGVNPAADGSRLAALGAALSRAVAAVVPSAIPTPEIDRQTLFGSPNADPLNSLAPAFVGFLAYFFVFILTGISFLRERVGGTLERLLATPITRGEIVLGYSLGFGLFATIQVLLVLAFTLVRVDVPAVGPMPDFVVGLHVPIAGSPVLAFVIALLLVLGAVSLGIFLSTFARTEFQILQFIPIVIVPQALLSGMIWPVNSLPNILQPLGRVLPVTYAIDGLRDVMIRGYDLSATSVQLDVAVLAGIALLFVALAATTIRRQVA